MVEITRLPVPEFVTMTPSGVLEPASCVPKLRVVELRLTLGAVPVPDKASVCGLPPALSLMLREAVRLPAAAGVKVKLRVVLA
jgi:hypothetical protein